MLKQAKGSQILVDECWSTNAREARINTGTKFSRNVKRIQRENEEKAAALRPMLELKAEFGDDNVDGAVNALEEATANLNDAIEDKLHG
jgi:hypothetical protein